jgi:acetoin utilization deacetylase AcuC-like enzyme
MTNTLATLRPIQVVYGPAMAAESECYSPSALKPRLLAEHLTALGFPVEFVEPIALQRKDLRLAHEPGRVNRILDCRDMNGFGNKSFDVAQSLPYTSGSVYQATLLALTNTSKMAASFSSGFHHAGYDYCGGFCTFNGLVIAAQKLWNAGKVVQVMILDLDAHYGDGTEDIIRKLKLHYIRHESFGSECIGEDYLSRLRDVMDSLQDGPRPDVIIYQAGADVHVNDPLGSGVLTTEQMAERERIVFSTTKKLGIPIAWNLAGGYQRDEDGGILPVLQLHEQTYRIVQEIYS